MTEKLYVGPAVDCQVIRLAVDFVMDYPRAPDSGPMWVTPEVAQARRVAWFGLTQPQREAIIANPDNTDYEGWTLAYSYLYEEGSPGIRRACFIPSDIATKISVASAAGRTLTIAQALAITAAQAVWLDNYPANWVEPT